MKSFVVESVTNETQTDLGGINPEVDVSFKEVLQKLGSIHSEVLPRRKFKVNVDKIA